MKGVMSERLSELLWQNGLTQKELAKKANITEAALSHYIKGDRCPRAVVLARLADALNTTSDYLIGSEMGDDADDFATTRRLIARSAPNMTTEQKAEIAQILFGTNVKERL